MQGAINRARFAREALDGDFGVGMEGGFQQIGSQVGLSAVGWRLSIVMDELTGHFWTL